MRVTCVACDKVIEVEDFDKDTFKGRYYCSLDCEQKNISSFMKKSQIVTRCEFCGDVAYFMPSRFFAKDKKFCSKKCAFDSKRKTVVIKCDLCGINFEKSECHVNKNGNSFCSKKCHNKYQSQYRVGEKGLRYDENIFTTNCSYCDSLIRRSVAEFKEHNFCNMECRKKYNKIKINCSWCDKELIRPKYRTDLVNYSFCDRDCKTKFYAEKNKGNIKYPSLLKEKFKINCSNCEKEIFKTQKQIEKNKTGLHFCCKDCAYKYKTKNKSANWKGGKVEVLCDWCGKSKLIYNGRYQEYLNGKKVFCNNDCQWGWRRETGELFGENNPNYTGPDIIVRCEICGIEVPRRSCQIKNNKTGIFTCSRECNKQYWSNVLSSRLGEDHPNWNGGCSDLRLFLRKSVYNDQCRKDCFDRDEYRSILSDKAGSLVSHHLHSFSRILRENKITFENWEQHKDKIYNVNNLVTILDEEHILFHKIYGYNVDKNNFEEFKCRYKMGELDGYYNTET